MWHSPGVHVNAKTRIFTDQRARGASVIKVDMSEKNSMKVGNQEAVLGKLFTKSRECGSRARIKKCSEVVKAQESRGNRVTMTTPEKIDNGSCTHGKEGV